MIEDQSIGLIVTSPPYPMIEMWDGFFADQVPDAGRALRNADGLRAFTLMHEYLAGVWKECFRVLKDGCFMCINVGDATRKIGDDFRLYTNHSRLTEICEGLGFETLPSIIWRKQTNAPSKFMGSGMLPSGAYVTLEHEYILVFRKGGKRRYTDDLRAARRSSAYFWEERNTWFSDLWEFRGTKQSLDFSASRKRSAAFPFELAFRLINMYSVQGETVLDPFLGIGTTSAAALVSARDSIGFDLDKNLISSISFFEPKVVKSLNAIVIKRVSDHRAFMAEYVARKGPAKYIHPSYGFPVVTSQETSIVFHVIGSVRKGDDGFLARHTELLAEELNSQVLSPQPSLAW